MSTFDGPDAFDVLIAGGGPAGMSAALTLGRTHRRVLLLDAGEGRNAPADAVHNFLTRDGTPPARLREIGRKELSAYPTVRIQDDAITDVAAGPPFEVTLAGDGKKVRARRLVLATGLADDLPDLPGVARLWGRSAFHCPYCHGYECTGKTVAVMGSEPARVRLALQLSRFAADVVLCTNGVPFQAKGIGVRCEPVVRLDADGDRLERIVFADGPPLDRDAVFVENVPRQRSDLAARLGCALLPDGSVEIEEFARTSVPGVYAAGDMARRATFPMPMAAVVGAAASGTLAGAVADQDLISEDFGLPNPFAARPA
ncbi:NAD(P)/FAD-dependent oxidoreductase [Actinomadura syzygii]|uniref:NAD(P)/FAD-dependent oxidoreductase n=1 Tax=Actinomadura syzygii TaxID=1427538 RepID=A0A5D0UM76_9ACTN|nr:NAD(P)/FAD-dependent oxidoreductase [Actinomadura syzygii]TYC18732.1 NAD(P)/FAD-dependent oxidoreductase [Actinomadura syzygii]